MTFAEKEIVFFYVLCITNENIQSYFFVDNLPWIRKLLDLSISPSRPGNEGWNGLFKYSHHHKINATRIFEKYNRAFAANQKRKNTQILTCWRDIVIWQGSCRLAHRLPLCPSGFRTSFVLLGDIASKLPKNHFHGCSQPIWWWFAISFQVWGPNVFQNCWPQINPSARLDFGEFVYVI